MSQLEVRSRKELRDLQRQMAAALFRPLTGTDRMQKRWTDGRAMSVVAAEFIKPNNRLTSFERLELYNRQYWFRLLDCFYDDFPGLRAALGERRFKRLAQAYLARFPSASFTARNLGSRLERFIRSEPRWAAPWETVALDLVRFEWAEIVAFDGPANPILDTDDLLGSDPAVLRLGLQPYLSLLELKYPIDDFVIAAKKRDAGLRGEASNAVNSSPSALRKKAPRLPARGTVYVAVHRCDDALYYKRLPKEAFRILKALRRGATVEQACLKAIAAAGRNSAEIDWAGRVREWFSEWASLGWFCQAKG